MEIIIGLICLVAGFAIGAGIFGWIALDSKRKLYAEMNKVDQIEKLFEIECHCHKIKVEGLELHIDDLYKRIDALKAKLEL